MREDGTQKASRDIRHHIHDVGRSGRYKVLMNFVADAIKRRSQCTQNNQGHSTFKNVCGLKETEKKKAEQGIGTDMCQLVHMENRGKALGGWIG